jgi:hypothetical protein
MDPAELHDILGDHLSDRRPWSKDGPRPRLFAFNPLAACRDAYCAYRSRIPGGSFFRRGGRGRRRHVRNCHRLGRRRLSPHPGGDVTTCKELPKPSEGRPSAFTSALLTYFLFLINAAPLQKGSDQIDKRGETRQ